MDNQKLTIPIKTKIASILAIINGGIIFLIAFGVIKDFHYGWWYLDCFYSILAPFFLYLLFSFSFIFFPLFLLKKKRWGWWGTIVSLVCLILLIFFNFIFQILGTEILWHMFTGGYNIIFPFFPIHLLILAFFLLDKKAVWKISPPLQPFQIKKLKIKFLIGVSIVIVLLASGLGIREIFQPQGEAFITVDKNEYEIGDIVRITAKNNTNKEIWCPESRYRSWWILRGPTGKQIPYSLPGNEEKFGPFVFIGLGIPKMLKPNSEISYLWNFRTSNLEPGIYKISFFYGFSKEYYTHKTVYSKEFELKEE